MVQLFTSVGLAYLINGLVGAIAGKRMLSFDIPISRVVKVGDIYLVTPYEFMILGIVLATVIFLHIFLQYTIMGKHIRAVADNQELAKIRGINPDRCSDLVWFIASSLAGLGGIFPWYIRRCPFEYGLATNRNDTFSYCPWRTW